MTDTEATADTAEGTADKAEATPEQKAQRQAARTIARALSKLEEGTPEEQKARWSEKKTEYGTQARRLVRALVKDGITFKVDEDAPKKGKRGGGKKGKKAGGAGETAED